MPSKYQIISELASQTARDITSKAERYTDGTMKARPACMTGTQARALWTTRSPYPSICLR